MNLLRSDQLASLQALLVECRKSVDYFYDAADFVEDPEVSEKMLDLADSRNRVTHRLEDAVRELGDLPTAPDTDRETGELLLDHARASLAEDKTAQVIQQRLHTERELVRQLRECYESGAGETQAGCLRALSDNIDAAVVQLRDLRS